MSKHRNARKRARSTQLQVTLKSICSGLGLDCRSASQASTAIKRLDCAPSSLTVCPRAAKAKVRSSTSLDTLATHLEYRALRFRASCEIFLRLTESISGPLSRASSDLLKICYFCRKLLGIRALKSDPPWKRTKFRNSRSK